MTSLFIGFSTPIKFHILPQVIKFADKTKFSHTYIKYYSESLDRWIVYQASGLKVNFISEENFLKENKVIEEVVLEITPEQRKSLVQRAIDLCGTSYSVLQLIGMAKVRLFGFFGIKKSNPFRDNSQSYICSELVLDLLKNVLNYPVDHIEDLSPRDVYLLLTGR